MKRKIIIIGAGISGLYLAYLMQDKYEITILEARDRIGGRIYSQNEHDLGPSWVWAHHKRTLKLLEELNLKIFQQYTQGYALYDAPDIVQRFTPQASIPSFRVEGSLTTLIKKLANKLDKVNLLLSQDVIKIKHIHNTTKIYTSQKSFSSDYVISTLPPRLVAKIDFHPQLPSSLYDKLLLTPTWMANSMKCVIEFKKPFWRERGLSGFMFSNIGPVAEMHDACTKEKAALFGFVHANASIENFEENLTTQLQRVLDIEPKDILNIYFVDWKQESFSSSAEDSKPLRTHPSYGIDTSTYSDKVFFSSTEFSSQEGGYIEGAIAGAEKTVQKILKIDEAT